MASTHPFSDGPWLCKHCHKPFSQWEDLLKHKQQRRNDNKEDHIHCKFCGRDFHTLAGELRHLQMEHPLEQSLECPGCGYGPFTRLSSLIDHIERGFCPRIDTAVLDQLREEKLEFPRLLEQLTKESIKGNYMKYMPSAAAKSTVSGWHLDKEPTSFEMIQEEFPILSTTDDDRTRPAKATASSTLKPSDKNHDKFHDKKGKQPYSLQLPFRPAIKTDETLAPDIKDKAPHTIELPLRLLSDSNRNAKDGPPNSNQVPLRPAFKSGVTTIIAGMDPYDPNNPAFSAASCYCEITEKFNCPKRLCGKTFKTAGGLVGHLRSPIHGNKTYKCPCCLKMFKTLAGITSHAESRGTKCRIQDTVHYETFMDQLTAGIVDIERTRYQGGSIIYKTSEQVKQKLRGETIKEKNKYPMDTEDQETYW